MAEQNSRDGAGLDRRLAALADHGARVGRLGTAEQARQRGDRRRRGTRLATAACGLVLVAVVAGAYATQRGHGAPGLPAATRPVRPVASASPSAGPAPEVTPRTDPSAVPGDGVPDRQQAVWLQATTTDGYPLLTALPDGTLAVTDQGAATDGALFALVPLAPGATEYLLKTGTVTSWGEPGCAARDGAGFAVVACDAVRPEQRVTLRGRAAPYQVVVGGKALELTRAGLAAAAPGQGTPLTFIVRGRAQDPFG
ncbi:hypothetical protein Cs7R123_02420 [Catellatospora sp. TT07R-123]|uniref:hypothetical protein n=1 Tax=Catellatospora sp. TT07R-123 TaxID=2733863 RepID=UPI001B001CCD|nr:hypothetical protein [Catellatospora sp. TT07R-123]GHJ42900.1 hypothetical protein Cs7R123_02420 [Catellatospora sp. TT07R-123]